jgi:hypothetical protein
MTLQDRQELNFVNFQLAHLAPIFSLYSASNKMAASRSRSLCFAQASLIEGVCWVSLGALVGYFDPTTANRFAGRMLNVPGLEKVLIDWEYLFDTEWLEYVRAITWVRTIPELHRQADMERAANAFEACLLRTLCLSRTPAANAAVAIFDFDRVDDIESYLALDVSIEDLSEAIAADAGIDEESGDILTGSLYGGFGEMINFLDGFLETRHSFQADDVADALFRKVAQLLRWRFYFIENKSDLYHPFVNRYLDILGVGDYALRATFRSHLDSLAVEWRGMQGPALAAANASN